MARLVLTEEELVTLPKTRINAKRSILKAARSTVCFTIPNANKDSTRSAAAPVLPTVPLTTMILESHALRNPILELQERFSNVKLDWS